MSTTDRLESAGTASLAFLEELFEHLQRDPASVPADWRAPPARLAEFPSSGQRAAVTVGPAGEWIELVELAGLETASPGLALPD